MGVLIVAGFAVIIVEMGRRLAGLGDSGPAASLETVIGLPAGARIETIAGAGERLAVQVTLSDGSGRIYFLDPDNGAVTGVVDPGPE